MLNHPFNVMAKYNSWELAPRDPVSVAVGGWLLPSLAGTFTATAVGFLVTTAITSWAVALLTPKPNAGKQGLLTNSRDSIASGEVVYGEVRKGGTTFFMEASGDKNKFLHIGIALASHEIDSVVSYYINDEKVTRDSNGFVDGKWKNKVKIRAHLGTSNQTADADIVSETTQTSSFRGRNVAYMYVRLEWDQEVFADGIPNFTATIRGKKVLDPRTNTTVWSNNPVLCIRDYIANYVGATSTEFNNTYIGASASICEQSVTKKVGSEKRYTLNGAISLGNSHKKNLSDMITSCGGDIFWAQGKWHIKAGHFMTPASDVITLDELRSEIDMTTRSSRKESFNTIIGIFNDAEKDYVAVDYPKYVGTTFVAEDGGEESPTSFDLPFTTSSATAQRLAKMALFRSREQIIIKTSLALKFAAYMPGDVLNVNIEKYGWSNKPFEIVDWELGVSSGEVVVDVILKETSAASYNWNAEEKDIIYNNTNLVDPRTNLTPSGLIAVTSSSINSKDGRNFSHVDLSWNAPQNPFIIHYNVRWRATGVTNWSSTTVEESQIRIENLLGDKTYNFQVQAVASGGFTSPWVSTVTTTVMDTTPPGLPTNIVTSSEGNGIKITWTNPTAADFSHVEVYANNINSTTGRVKVGNSYNGEYTITGLSKSTNRYIWLRSVDYTGNVSSYTASVLGTSAGIPLDQLAEVIETTIADGSITVAKFATGIRPLEILGALPTTGNTVGRQVYLTTDGKTYRWTGSAWTANVSASDISGTLGISTFAQNIRPVEIVSALPTTGNFNGRQVYLTTDSKNYRYNGTAWTSSVPTVDLVGSITADAVAAGSINTASFATNIRPLEIVSTLPTTGNFNGRQVFLTTDGKNYRYASGAWTSSVPTVDLVGTVSTAQIANNAINASKIGNLAVEASKLADNAVTTDKIVASAIVGDKIAGNTIAASKIIVSDNHNLFGDTELLDIDYWSLGGAASITTEVFTDETAVRKFSLPAPLEGGTSSLARTSRNIPVKPGEEYVISANIRSAGSAPRQFSAYFGAWFYDKAGTYVTSRGGITVKTTVNLETVTQTIVVPDNCYFMRPGFQRSYTVGDSNSGYVMNPRIYRRTSAELIVDGAITTDKLVANAITTDKLAANAVTAGKIEANAITSDKIAANSIIAGKIAAGAISTSELAANAVNADKIAAGAITSGKIEANAIVAGKIATDAVTSDKIAANAITSGKIAANAIVAGKIAAGAIGTDQLGANVVMAKNIFVGNFENLVPNGDFLEDDLSYWFTPSGGTFYLTTTASSIVTGVRSVVLQKSTPEGVANVTTRPEFAASVKPGEVLYGEMTYRTNNSATTQGAYLRAMWYKGDGTPATPSYSDFIANAPMTNSFVTRGSQVTAPDDASSVTFRLYNHNTQTTSTNLIIDRILVRRTTDTNLVVDGSITTGKIQVGAVGADQIAARAISAGKLAITDNSNMFLDSELLDPNYWGFTGGAGISSDTVTNETSIRKLMLPVNNGVSTRATNKELITVSPGDSYMLVGDLRGSGVSPVKFTCRLTVWWFDKDKVYLSSSNRQVIRTNAAVVTESYTITVPTNAQYMRVGFERPSSTTDDTGTAYIMNPRLYKRYGGELIVDGAITAEKVNTTSFQNSGLSLFGGELRSTGFVAGTSGWRIQNNGTAEFNNIIERSDLKVNAVSNTVDINQNTTIEGTSAYVYQTTGNLVVPNQVDLQFYGVQFGIKRAQTFDGSSNVWYDTQYQLQFREYIGNTWTGWSNIWTLNAGNSWGIGWSQTGTTGVIMSLGTLMQFRVGYKHIASAVETKVDFNVIRNIKLQVRNIQR